MFLNKKYIYIKFSSSVHSYIYPSVFDDFMPHGDRFPRVIHHFSPVFQRRARCTVTDDHLADSLVWQKSVEIGDRQNERNFADFVDGDVEIEALVPHRVECSSLHSCLLFVDPLARINQVDFHVRICL